MLSSSWGRVLSSAFLAAIATIAYGAIECVNILGEAQQYVKGPPIKDPFILRMVLAWPVLAAMLLLGVGALQAYIEYIGRIGDRRQLIVVAVLYLCALPMTGVPSYAMNTYPNMWDNQDIMLVRWPYLAGALGLGAVNLAWWLNRKKQERA